MSAHVSTHTLRAFTAPKINQALQYTTVTMSDLGRARKEGEIGYTAVNAIYDRFVFTGNHK